MTTPDPHPEVADGVYRCGSERVNWYLIEGNEGLTVVDTGFPTHWEQVAGRLERLNYELSDIAACLLTHAHPDHIGFAQRLHEEAAVPVWLHEAGVQRAREGGDPPLGGVAKNLWRPAILRYFIEVLRSDGTSVPPVTDVDTFTDGAEFDVPGQPQAVHVPGHTEDEVAFYLPDRNVLLCGDAVATIDFETWRGNTPQLLPPWLNVDHDQAQASLVRLKAFGEVVLLPGHGDPWTGDLSEITRAE